MSESVRMWMEISFNIVYLLVVWGLVIAMLRRRPAVAPGDKKAADLVLWAFALLAIGDTGHVGFRVLAYASGNLDAQINIIGRQVGLVGLGALSTAITVTVFYILMLELWRVRFNKRYGWYEYLLIGLVIARFIFMSFPVNDWNCVVPPQTWSTLRNLPLTILGLSVAYLMLRDATRSGDRAFQWIGGMILFSYAMYIPVIFFVQSVPLIGMLMIPKTMAYVAIGFIAYYNLCRNPLRGTKQIASELSA
jgi:hypothetical protein